jgi:hypothetical protein
MNVKKLKKLLNNFNDEDIIILQKDSEGNGYSPLCDIYEGSYEEDTPWSGEVGLRELTDELKEKGYAEEDVASGVNAVILCPMN